MESITLINCPILEPKKNYTFSTTIPLGVAYIAAYLRKNRIDINLIDGLGENIEQITKWDNHLVLIGLTLDQIIGRIPKKMDIIGISTNMTSQRAIHFKLIEKIREIYPEKIIVVGGNDATCNPEIYLNKSVNYIILNEAEISLLKLVKNLNNQREVNKISGIGYKNKKGELIIQPFITSNTCLDDLPFPARDLLPLQNYWRKKSSHGPVNNRYTSIISSRGCPFDCSFCSSKIFWKRKWNCRSAENFISEIEECINKYGITDFEIEDDNLTLDLQRFNKILDLIIKKNLKINWTTPNGIRSENLDYKLLKKIKKSGCTHLTIAPESGSKRILTQVYHKHIDLENMIEVVKNCNKLGIKICAFFVVGLPQETKKDKKLTLKYIKKLARVGLDEVGIFPCIPLPKTEIRQKYFYHLSEELMDAHLFQGEIPSWYPNRKEVSKFITRLYLTFLVTKSFYHPLKIIKNIINILENKQSLKMEREIIRRLENLKKNIFLKNSRQD